MASPSDTRASPSVSPLTGAVIRAAANDVSRKKVEELDLFVSGLIESLPNFTHLNPDLRVEEIYKRTPRSQLSGELRQRIDENRFEAHVGRIRRLLTSLPQSDRPDYERSQIEISLEALTLGGQRQRLYDALHISDQEAFVESVTKAHRAGALFLAQRELDKRVAKVRGLLDRVRKENDSNPIVSQFWQEFKALSPDDQEYIFPENIPSEKREAFIEELVNLRPPKAGLVIARAINEAKELYDRLKTERDLRTIKQKLFVKLDELGREQIHVFPEGISTHQEMIRHVCDIVERGEACNRFAKFGLKLRSWADVRNPDVRLAKIRRAVDNVFEGDVTQLYRPESRSTRSAQEVEVELDQRHTYAIENIAEILMDSLMGPADLPVRTEDDECDVILKNADAVIRQGRDPSLYFIQYTDARSLDFRPASASETHELQRLEGARQLNEALRFALVAYHFSDRGDEPGLMLEKARQRLESVGGAEAVGAAYQRVGFTDTTWLATQVLLSKTSGQAVEPTGTLDTLAASTVVGDVGAEAPCSCRAAPRISVLSGETLSEPVGDDTVATVWPRAKRIVTPKADWATFLQEQAQQIGSRRPEHVVNLTLHFQIVVKR